VNEYPDVKIEAEIILQLGWPARISESNSLTTDGQMFNFIEVKMNREETFSTITKFKEIVERLENIVRLMQQ
jgi:hypothetical protein